MNDYPMIEIGCERNEAGEPLVRVGGALCGTVEGLKGMIDEFWERETLRKLREMGVSLTLRGGEPRINVPAAVAGVVVFGNERAKSVPPYDPRVGRDGVIVLSDEPAEDVSHDDPRKDPKIQSAIRDASRRGWR
ncbi:hypothetical protein [Rhizobium sp. LC145]|uniref:hypothetical protein n=1 Tax=Rhizobium sp. LC145 TaxID=1120688 RepID=UPI00062A465D|nr:hypothetical protein [Rhizobium sp. LC145]KKX29175.1 hypothetical protein YH62_15335 [Rhizobium sp. LC145]TKT42781.1 hypothetical protein FDR95_28000 [Rhizobiaceae bacterium LC148]